MSSLPSFRPMYVPADSRPVEDPLYLKWIRSLPCSVPGCRWRAEPHHTGIRGLSQKADDRRAIPLCRAHHEECEQNRQKFELTHGIDIEILIARLNEKPIVRIYQGRFVALLAGEEYDLGPSRITLANAIRAALQITRERPLVMRL